MGKYIINFEDNPSIAPDREKYYKCCEIPWWVAAKCTLSKLTPYIEPDMEQVRKEAYDKGYDDATAEIGSDEQAIAEKAYQKGLSDAWEAAKKIYLPEDHGGLGYDMLMKIFNTDNKGWLFKNLSASEALEEIREYEQKKEEIKVGDEVVGIYTGGEETEPFVIIRKIPEIDPTYYFGIYSKSGEFCQGGLKLKKTGRHFPEIAEVLQKMKESES